MKKIISSISLTIVAISLLAGCSTPPAETKNADITEKNFVDVVSDRYDLNADSKKNVKAAVSLVCQKVSIADLPSRWDVIQFTIASEHTKEFVALSQFVFCPLPPGSLRD